MGMPVVTVASGGMPVVDVTATTGRGTPVTEATNGFGRAVTKVASGGMAVAYETIGIVTPVTYVTWDPVTITAATLSSGNLAITNTGTTSGDQGARVVATAGKTSGKYYFEITTTAVAGIIGANAGLGVATTSSTYTAMGNNGTSGAEVFPKNGAIFANGGYTGSPNDLNFPAVNGTAYGIAIDLDNRKAWFKNLTGAGTNSGWNGNPAAGYNPATNTGGVTVPTGTIVPFCNFGGSGGTSGNVWTANFGATTFTGAVPAGFTSGWPS